jgi:putative transposase
MTRRLPASRTSGTCFLTLRLAQPRRALLVRHIDLLRRAMRETMTHHPFAIEAIVVLPAAIHAVWTLPPGAADFAKRIGMLKSRFSRGVAAPPARTPSQVQRGDKGIWQRGYWLYPIRGAAELARHREMIHLAPVTAGFCARAADWPHSSVHRDIARGLSAPDGCPTTPLWRIMDGGGSDDLQRRPLAAPDPGAHRVAEAFEQRA